MNERPVAIVTGSAVGIGRALSIGFARRGYCVVGFDIDTVGNAITAELVGEAMAATTCDVGDAAAVREAIDGVVDRTGRVDVLINNAALWNNTTLTGGSYEEQVAAFRKAIDSCAMGTFHCTAAAVTAMASGANVVNLITEHIRMERLITGLVGTGYDRREVRTVAAYGELGGGARSEGYSGKRVGVWRNRYPDASSRVTGHCRKWHARRRCCGSSVPRYRSGHRRPNGSGARLRFHGDPTQGKSAPNPTDSRNEIEKSRRSSVPRRPPTFNHAWPLLRRLRRGC